MDAIYIDGDHTYEGAKSDIEIWLPKLKIGGLKRLSKTIRI